MSAEGLELPVCPVVAWHRSYDPHVFSCGLPAGHDGKHGQETSPGVWVHWDITMGFNHPAPPPNPADDVATTLSGWNPHPSQRYDLNAFSDLATEAATSDAADPGER